MESRLTELEIKLSYAEDLLDELNRTVFRQQEQIESLQRQIVQLQRQLQDMEPPERGDLREEIPPHY
ncbi:MAG: SlyX family protein [Hydrogenophilaceae bacterium]|nr:SlyX family protein [Hydrogenophilaceae bacterium]